MKRFISLLITLIILTGLDAAPRFSLLTIYPGKDIYTLEGHTALRLQIPEQGVDVALNWGVFDFNSPNFVYRFVKGETDYMAQAEPTMPMIHHYALNGRQIIEQDLDLTTAETERLMDRISRNMLPENRVYRYNYIYDNCATRPRDHIEGAVGSLKLGNVSNTSDNTFREIMRTYHANYPWYQFGIDLALGSGLDKEVTTREKTFAPLQLMEAMGTATVGTDGRRLVSDTRMLFPRMADATLPPTPWFLTPMAVACLVFVLTGFISWMRPESRWLDSVLFGIYGVMGMLLTFLIFISVHEATSPNWLYLWLNPLPLYLAIGVWVRRWRKAVYWGMRINGVLCIALIVIGICGIQSLNPAFYPLIGADLIRSFIPRKLGEDKENT